ncbi:MAG: hypothetical protein Q7K42_06615, partial [Candidatus Diapherotrites archaeon]|nr:hypothetical protein [Candidatus Diapherotrites archaeon]
MDILKDKSVQFDTKIVGYVGEHKDIARTYISLGAKVKILEGDVTPIRFSIIDSELATITLEDHNNDYLAIWTNDPGFVENLIKVFDWYWKKAKFLKKD